MWFEVPVYNLEIPMDQHILSLCCMYRPSLIHSAADPCLNNPCDVNANCVLNSNHSCVCNPPFVGDGFNCTLGE